jgi:hypothetical protein
MPCGRRAQHGSMNLKPDQIRASKFMGSTVYDLQNQEYRQRERPDLRSRRTIEAAVIDVGAFLGMGGKYVAVKLNDIKTTNNRLTLDMSKEGVSARP